ncbi:hypothetical protein SGFS_013530 [Streptomyces graminofaciens]|uniref:Uncharacterized protein n=1 Tax=Streptomyces graminofaciens TaxID=68212 RepID=A0ABM7F2P1_9ACTN|nr:hypothetical protein [Streptomyces graminofaciens]BBC30059.1 hypothetical protein SGFS_013530 [Streptomyces graminofaciens]
MSTSNPTISSEVAAHVLSHFGRPGGYPAGDWTESLISLIDRADMTNRAKLLGAYPDYGAAITLAKYDEAGIDTLQAMATGITLRCTRCRDEDGPFTAAGLCEACARPMPLGGAA